MTDAPNPAPRRATKLPPRVRAQQKPSLLQFPGIVAISVYMLMVAGYTVASVVSHSIGPVYLVFSTLFIAAALGLLLLFRWAWALTLAAVALMAALFLWSFAAQHQRPSLVQGLINLVIFLYLVRSDLREKLR